MPPSQPRLSLKLPASPATQLYQLVFIGKHWIASAGTLPRQVTLYFHRKHEASRFYEPTGRWLSRRIHVAETLALVVGSLWNADGEMVSDGRAIVLPATDLEDAQRYDVLGDIRSFTLGPAPSQPLRLSSIFDLRKLRSKFLRRHGSSWAVVHQEGDTHFVIPCNEILRTFYYVDGRRLADFLSAYTPIDQVCQVMQQPTAANDGEAHIAVVTDGFTPHQLCVLAEMSLTKSFLDAAVHAHSTLVAESSPTRKGTYLRLAFAPDRPVRISANGFGFTHQGKRYFWVCAIQSHEGLWSFDTLRCHWNTDHRSATVAEPNAVPGGGSSLSIRLLPSPTAIPLDSNRPAEHQGDDVELALPGFTVLPEVEIDPKLDQQGQTPGTGRFIGALPDFLTQQGGKGDKGGGRAGQVRSVQDHMFPRFFEQIIEQIALQAPHQVARVLELNNAEQRWDSRISVFPYWWKEPHELFNDNGLPRPLGIVEFSNRGVHFYFLQLLYGKRGAMVYRADLEPLTDHQLNQLLYHYAEARLNWVSLAKMERQPGGPTELARLIGCALVVEARNYFDADEKAAGNIARICLASIQKVAPAQIHSHF